MQRSATSSTALGLGLAASICNLTVILLPIGLVLGLVALILALIGSGRSSSAGGSAPALALTGVSFAIAAIWTFTIVSVFFIDPTLL